jgi:hypothetical protein
MSISYFGAGVTPSDTGSGNEGATGTPAPMTVAPPASMTDGMLALLWAYGERSRTFSMSETGGQTWNSGTNHADGTYGSFRLFWSRFNGTWSANPSAVVDAADYGSMSVGLLAFSPTTSANTWDVDVAEAFATYAAPGAPYDVTLTGVTTIAADTVTLGFWTSRFDSQWALQTGGWSNPGGATQWRNAASDDSISVGYKIQTAAGATGNVTNRQTSSVDGIGQKLIVAFKEIASGTNNPMMSRPRPTGRFWR